MNSSELQHFVDEPDLINANPKHPKISDQDMIKKFGEKAFINSNAQSKVVGKTDLYKGINSNAEQLIKPSISLTKQIEDL